MRACGVRFSLSISWFVCFFFWVAHTGKGDDGDLLTPGLGQITPGRVTSTIAFLASDELAGRATGSVEFKIASSYVAARFRGAGLEGGASNGDFYHETRVRMTRTPSQGVVYADSQSRPMTHFGLLASGAAPVSFAGDLTPLDLAKELPQEGLSGVVGGALPDEMRGPRASFQLMRLSKSLKAAGATALLIGVAADSELIADARDAREKLRPESARGAFPMPVLLVAHEGLEKRSIKVELPAIEITEAPMRNVIGMIRGSDPALAAEAILFSAHLDHLGTRSGVGDEIFNGADDDASGVTAVLMLADAFGAMSKPKRTVLFLTFWGEESGLLGSREFVATPTWPLENIVANINVEMIGRPEGGAHSKIWMTGWRESTLGELMNQGSQKVGVEIFEHPKFSSMLYRSSDNWSLAEKGVVAHSFSAGSLHADYHQPDDEWERLEIPHMARVIQGLFAGSWPLAQGEVTPTKREKR